MKNSESPFSPSLCNYYEKTPKEQKHNFQITKIKQVNLDSIYKEIDSISKDDLINDGNSLKLNKSSLKYTKSQFNNNNFQLISNNNINSSSLSYQYSDSEKISEYSNINKKNIQGKKEDKFIIQRNENLEIFTSNNEYLISQCISINNVFTTFSIEINPKFKIEKLSNQILKIDNKQQICFIPKKKFNDLNKRNNDIKINNGFKLVPLNIIDERCSATPLNSRYKTIETSSPHNKNYLKNPFSALNNTKTNKYFVKKLLTQIKNNNKKKNEKNRSKEKNNSNNSKRKNILNSNSKNKQKNENKIKPNSNNDINDIIKRHFQQKTFPLYNSNSKGSKGKNNSKKFKKPNNKKIISYTSFSNKLTKKPLTIEITNNLIKDLKNQNIKINKTQMYSSIGKNNKKNNINNRYENQIKISRQKIKTHINLSSILNKFNSNSLKNKSNNNKSLVNFNGIISKNQTININPKDIKNNILKQSIDNNQIIKNQENKTLKENNINSNNNSYASKIIHTQETVNTTKDNNNNYIITTTNFSSIKKSPKVINDFSFYKKKVNYRSHFVSLINPRENNQNYNNLLNSNNTNYIDNNICQSDYKFFPRRKQPIASIKLMKLEGDIDSNISRDSDE